MKFKFIGFWKEEGYQNMPSILDSIGKAEAFETKFERQLYKYLSHGVSLDNIWGYNNSLIDGAPILSGNSHYSDGKWIWKWDTWYHFKNHNVALPKEFIADVKKAFVLSNFSFYLKMFWLHRKREKIIQAFFENEKGYPKNSRNGKYLDLLSKNSPYKNSIILSVPKEQIKTQLSKDDWIILSAVKLEEDLFLELVLEEMSEKEDIVHLKLNILALNPDFFLQHLKKQFCLSTYKEEIQKDKSLGYAKLEKIKTKQ